MAKIIRAEHMGFCFGVRDAVAAAQASPNPQQTSIYGELVHNTDVMDSLSRLDYQLISETQRDVVPTRPLVMVTAHGISDRRRTLLEESGKQLIDTTCPLVRRVHKAAIGLIERDFFVVLIGNRNHVEVQGIVEDLPANRCVVVSIAAEVVHYDAQKIGIISQTTIPDDLADDCRNAVADQNPNASIRWINTICRPTRQRQNAIDKLCEQVDVVIVVGGKNSNNTRRLVQRCQSHDVVAHHVQAAADLDSEWLVGHECIGLTAGTSTPDETIDTVEQEILRLSVEREISVGLAVAERAERFVFSEKPKASAASATTAIDRSTLTAIRPKRMRRDKTWCHAWSNRQWSEYFRDNMDHAPTIPWSDTPTLRQTEKDAVIASIQTFQLGESGQGRHICWAAQNWIDQGGDAEYLVALKLFLREENCHAAWLGKFLQQEGEQLLQKQWSNQWFRRVRQLAGLRTSVMVLLTAEILAQVYYLALMRATDSNSLQVICQRVLRDERSHVVFQQNQANDLASRWSKACTVITGAVETVGFYIARRIVWYDHRSVFDAAAMDWTAYRDRTTRRWLAARRRQTR